MAIGHSLRRLVRAVAGVDMRRHNSMIDPFLRTAEVLRQHNVDTVLDVGANDGGYGSELMRAGYSGRLISFEPLPDARAQLLLRARAWPGRWVVAPPVALSDRDGSATFNVAGNSASSSLLDMAEAHTEAAPGSGMAKQITVNTQRLDNLWPALEIGGRRVFMKVDTQGSERMVLDGAGDLLRGPIVGLQLEMSLTPLYKGQLLAHDLDAHVRRLRFVPSDIIPGFRDPKTLRLLQYDGVYFREE